MDNYYERIAKSLERIADALEKMTAPSEQGWGPEDEEQLLGIAERKFSAALHGVVRNQLTMAFQEEALRLQSENTGLFQSGEHDTDSSL